MNEPGHSFPNRCPHYSPGGEFRCTKVAGHAGPCEARRTGPMNPGAYVVWFPAKTIREAREALRALREVCDDDTDL